MFFRRQCMMKKGRAAVILSAISPPSRVGLLEQVIFQHSTSIGIRRHVADRHKLIRHSETVETEYGPIRGKVVTLPGGQQRFAVEDDDAKEIAQSNQTTTANIRNAAQLAWAK